MLRYLVLILFVVSSSSVFAETETDHIIHEELRALLQGIVKTVNDEQYDKLAPFFHKNLRVTTINQEVISSHAEITTFFKKWFGPGGFLKKLDMQLNADATTELFANNTLGIVRGSGIENYIASDTRSFDFKTRWTATVIKDTDGKWRILSLHIGTDFLDNPVLFNATDSLTHFTIGGFLGGLILMFILNLLIRRFRKK